MITFSAMLTFTAALNAYKFDRSWVSLRSRSAGPLIEAWGALAIGDEERLATTEAVADAEAALDDLRVFQDRYREFFGDDVRWFDVLREVATEKLAEAIYAAAFPPAISTDAIVTALTTETEPPPPVTDGDDEADRTHVAAQ